MGEATPNDLVKPSEIFEEAHKESGLSFKEACEKLGIERYAERIFHSNSRGELFHLYDYIRIVEICGSLPWFSEWFDFIVDHAEKNWDRPESVFQHMPRMLKETLGNEEA